LSFRTTIVGLVVAASLAVGLSHRPAKAQEVVGVNSDLTNLVTVSSYTAGMGFAIGAILKFKHHKDNPAQVPIGTPVALVFAGAALLFLPSILDVTGSTMLGTQSCPVFIGSGTALGEDSCTWAKFMGETSGQGASQAISWQVGGQYEVGPGWFLGGALGTKALSAQSTLGQESQRTFDGAVVVKRVKGPLYLSAALGLSSTTEQATGTLPFGNGTLTSNSNSWSAGVLLRGAYQVTFDPVYLRPRLDIGVGLTNDSGTQMNGSAGTLTVDPSSSTGVQFNPMLEVGGRVDVGSVVLRPYMAAGPMYVPTNYRRISGNAFGSPYAVNAYGASLLLNGEAGVQIYANKLWDAKLEYRMLAADQYFNQSLGLRFARHF